VAGGFVGPYDNADGGIDVTNQEREEAIEEARKQMEACWNRGENTLARRWAAKLRDLVSERTPERVEMMERKAGLR
jgi:hypothetical protein